MHLLYFSEKRLPSQSGRVGECLWESRKGRDKDFSHHDSFKKQQNVLVSVKSSKVS